MNTLLWLCQALLALAFVYSGICKSVFSKEKLMVVGQTGVADISPSLIHAIGIAEILGAAGLILPWWLGILPVLTPAAAICFAVIMVLAAPIHYRRKETRNMVNNILLLIICLFVAYGRWV